MTGSKKVIDRDRRYALASIEFGETPGIDRVVEIRREIPRHLYQRYVDAVRTLHLARSTGLLNYVEDTLLDAEHNAREISRLVGEHGPFLGHHQLGDQVARLCTSSVLTVVSGFYMHQEHAEATAGRIGGADLKREVNDIYRAEYDAKPWLYLMLRLRHVMVHSTTDVISFATSSREIEPGSVEGTCSIVVNRRALFAASRGVNGAIRNYLETFEEDPDAVALMQMAFHDLAVIDGLVGPILSAGLRPAALVLSEIADCYGADSPAGRLLIRLSSDGRFVTDGHADMVAMPPETFEYGEYILRMADQPH